MRRLIVTGISGLPISPKLKGQSIGPLASCRWDRQIFPKRQLLTISLRCVTP